MIIFLEPFPRCEVVQSKDTQIFEGFWNEFPNCSSERPRQFNDLALVLYSISYYFSIPRPSFVIETYFSPSSFYIGKFLINLGLPVKSGVNILLSFLSSIAE